VREINPKNFARRAGLNFASHYPQNLPQVNAPVTPDAPRPASDGGNRRLAAICRRRSRRASLLAFRKGVGYTRRASSQAGFTGAVQTRFESRRDSISHPAETRRFFYSIADNGSAIVDEMFEAVDGHVGRARLHALDTERLSAVACESQETSGRRVTCPRRAIYARAVGLGSPAARLRSRTARDPDGSTEFQVNSSNRFSARAEVAHVNAGQVMPWQREARFRQATAEQSDLCQRTRPAVGLEIPTHLISYPRPTPRRRRRFRREVSNACARH
jgi:hypothetical protein